MGPNQIVKTMAQLRVGRTALEVLFLGGRLVLSDWINSMQGFLEASQDDVGSMYCCLWRGSPPNVVTISIRWQWFESWRKIEKTGLTPMWKQSRLCEIIPATTYSPTQLPAQYHQLKRA